LSFKIALECAARQKDSNIILALDLVSDSHSALLSKSIALVKKVQPYICAVKINHHLVLPLGLFNGVQKIIRTTHSFDLLTVMDCKINDIGDTNRVIANNYYDAGFDAVIANPFVGWEEGLQPVFEVAKQMKKGVVLLCYMSHKAAWEGYGQTIQQHDKLTAQYVAFAKKALEWNADGVVVGATFPEKIRDVHQILADKVPIYAPGVGAQGGDVRAAIQAGATYLIVGRTIINSSDPAAVARQIREKAHMRDK